MIKTSENRPDKLTPEELTEFRTIHTEYETYLFDLGLLTVEYEAVQERLTNLDKNKQTLISNIKSINEKRITLNNELSTKYGDKQVDLETGELK